MKKYIMALIALILLLNHETQAAQLVELSNKSPKGVSDGIFVTVNNDGKVYTLPPFNQEATGNPVQDVEGPVTRIVVQFASGTRAGNRVVWDWNKYNSIIRSKNAEFLMEHQNFPNDVTQIGLSTLGFCFSGPGYTNQFFEINCWSKNPMESDQCSNVIKN